MASIGDVKGQLDTHQAVCAELQDAEGVKMTAKAAKAFIATLP